MGNLYSKKNDLKSTSISNVLDYIATHYILTMDFKSLRKMYDKKYCDDLVILTSDIIDRHFTDIEITYLSERIQNGVEVNNIEKEKVMFINKNNLNKLDIQNTIKKKRMCNSIARFYIKIAHIFAAIVTTINPIYIYKDLEGNTVKASLYEKGKLPADTPIDIYKFNICDERINSLRGEQKFEPDNNGNITIKPNVCSMNLDDTGSQKYLDDEPGIPELEELYYDDEYDFDTAKFMGMSKKAKKNYENDLKIFYKIFTGKSELPSEGIRKFGDIKLKEYNKQEHCNGSDPLFKNTFTGPITEKLFGNYATHYKSMVQKANKNQEALIVIINKLFVYVIDPQTNKKQIRIKPELSEVKLQNIVVETRALIIKLYLTCEMDYVHGLKLYEALVENKILKTAQRQIKKLEKISEELIVEEKVPDADEIEDLKDPQNELKPAQNAPQYSDEGERMLPKLAPP
jgi:hypothetical protein